jgi:hypothetical protein
LFNLIFKSHPEVELNHPDDAFASHIGTSIEDELDGALMGGQE